MDKPTLQGEMLVLRPIRAEDSEAMWDLVTDAEGTRLTGTTAAYTREQVDAWCASRATAGGRFDFAVTVHGNDDFLGEIVLNEIDEVTRSANLRLAMRPSYRGRGYGTEGILLVLGFAFDGLGLHRVELDVLAITPAPSRSTRTSASGSRAGGATPTATARDSATRSAWGCSRTSTGR